MKAERVLLLDSAECDLRAVSWALAEAGFAVTVRGAARAHGSAAFDAVVVETRFDECDGVALAGELLSCGGATRVVFYTEATDQAIVRDARRIGPVVDKEAGPLRLVAALEAGSSPVSHFPEPDRATARPPAADLTPATGKRH